MKFIPYGQHCIDEGDIKAVAQVLRSGRITQGSKIQEFEDALCKYTGAKYAVAVANGTAALHIACLAAGIKPKDEAIVPALTFAASANCVLYCGGKVVFADIEKDSINIDLEEIKKRINKNTKAIIPVHYAGHPCKLEKIRKISRDRNIAIIEDAAHALGAKYKGSKIGSCKYSDMTIFSFHPVKHITTGEGGAVLTNRKELYEKLLCLRNHGITKDKSKFIAKTSAEVAGDWYHEMQYLGFNYRLTDFQCALGISQLRKLNRFLKQRKEIVDYYNKELGRINEIILPVEKPYAKSAWHIYCIRLRKSQDRKKVFDGLKKLGILSQVHYIPVYLHPYYRQLGYRRGLCPNAEDYYSRAITLPLYPSLRLKDARYIVKSLVEALRKVNK